MSHVVREAPPPFLSSDGRLRVRALPAATDNLVWLATCVATGATAVIDGPSAAEALDACDAEGLPLVAVLNTHTHGDHIGVNHDLVRRGRLPAVVYGGRAVAADIPGLTHPVDDGDTVQIGEVTGRVLRTDGHLFGHVCYVFDDVLFSGDTLFTGGCGKLFGGDAPAMFDSLLRLAALPGGTRVCCAHEYTRDNLRFARLVEPDNEALAARFADMEATLAAGRTCVPSTLDLERATNPFLRPGAPTLRARVRELVPDADTSTLPATFAATRRLKDLRLHVVDGGAPPR